MVGSLSNNGVTHQSLKLKILPYTLKDAAHRWFLSIPPQSIHTWREMHEKFVAKFYTYAKSASLRKQISNFTEDDDEPFHEAWDRFQTLLIQCPHHMLPCELQHSYFYDGLTPAHQTMVDNVAGGVLGGKIVEEIQEIFESLANNSLQKGVRRDTRGVHGINSNSNIYVDRQLASMQRQIEQLSMSLHGSSMQRANMYSSHEVILRCQNKQMP
ncbi:hypothetical protein LIER_37505 [Lithospermum erythrorhizon]|uniref:Retrotransposon gag domain-containing protein n=1 Tax=Lithospermum erythrorhizon TaxID=34254 RepID=A0AAV3PL99_LITER